jgi:hypothetical protein
MAADLSCATATDGVITVTATGELWTKTYSKDNEQLFKLQMYLAVSRTHQIKVDANSCFRCNRYYTCSTAAAIKCC